MAQILVRGLEDDTVERLKQRARRHNRSLQAEVRTILEDAADPDMERRARFRVWAREMRDQTAGTPQTDSAELIREDRER